MAVDILTIPAMSAAPKRRNRPHSDTTEVIECLKSWRKILNIQLESGGDVGLRLDQATM
jgi:hypothetical protein